LEVENDYILMLVSMEDDEWTVIDFKDGIYDFSTDDSLEETLEDELDDDAWDEGTGTWEAETVDNLSLNAAETPDSWAETNVLIALTFLINSFVFIRKKIFKK